MRVLNLETQTNVTVVVAEKVLESKETIMDKEICPLEHTKHAQYCSLLDSQKTENSVCQYKDECKQIYASLQKTATEEVL